eukprot:GHVU01048695.1.p1 GENE.GHVU01048695.1~~GHVU01048695.1.p1  ORF type:complete len:552 (+),score=74.79 GHVU01048695.1:408-2063(+)
MVLSPSTLCENMKPQPAPREWRNLTGDDGDARGAAASVTTAPPASPVSMLQSVVPFSDTLPHAQQPPPDTLHSAITVPQAGPTLTFALGWFPCPECESVFHYRAHLVRHFERAHPDMRVPVDDYTIRCQCGAHFERHLKAIKHGTVCATHAAWKVNYRVPKSTSGPNACHHAPLRCLIHHPPAGMGIDVYSSSTTDGAASVASSMPLAAPQQQHQEHEEGGQLPSDSADTRTSNGGVVANRTSPLAAGAGEPGSEGAPKLTVTHTPTRYTCHVCVPSSSSSSWSCSSSSSSADFGFVATTYAGLQRHRATMHADGVDQAAAFVDVFRCTCGLEVTRHRTFINHHNNCSHWNRALAARRSRQQQEQQQPDVDGETGKEAGAAQPAQTLPYYEIQRFPFEEWRCTVCSPTLTFSCKTDLRKHRGEVHSGKQFEDVFLCEKCGLEFPLAQRTWNTRRHYESCRGPRAPNPCAIPRSRLRVVGTVEAGAARPPTVSARMEEDIGSVCEGEEHDENNGEEEGTGNVVLEEDSTQVLPPVSEAAEHFMGLLRFIVNG